MHYPGVSCWMLAATLILQVTRSASEEMEVKGFVSSDRMDVLVVFEQVQGYNLSCRDYTMTVADDWGDQDPDDEGPDFSCDPCGVTSFDGSDVCACVCRNQKVDENMIDENSNIIINITSSRPPYTSLIRIYRVIDYIRPGKVVKLDVVDLTPNQAVLVFGLNEFSKSLVPELSYLGLQLRYRIRLTRLQDFVETLELTINKSYNTTEFPNYSAIKFNGLAPYTRYQVSVRGVGGGGEGESSSILFHTHKSVPVHPPVYNDITYSSTLENDAAELETVYVLWEEIPRSAAGGSDVSYKLEVKANGSTEYYNNHTHNAIYLKKARDDELTIKIWSVNEVGQSENYTEVRIPAEREPSPPRMVAEFYPDDEVKVRVQTESVSSATALALLWCEWDSQVGGCKDYPHTHILQQNATTSADPDVLELLVPLSTTPRVNTSSLPVLHYDLNDTTQTLAHPLTATGTVTVNTGSRPGTEEPDDCLSEVRSACRREWTDGCWCGVLHLLDEGASRDHEMTPTSVYEQTTEPVQTGGASTKLNLSIMVDGRWMGMVPAECYFNSSSNRAEVVVSHYTGGGGQLYLRVSQACDSSSARQFLADSFHVSASVDGGCQSLTPIKSIQNRIFGPTTLELPPGTSVVCVTATSSQGLTTSQPFRYTIALVSTGSSSQEIVIYAVVSLVAAVVVILLICLLFKCRQQKRHINNFLTEDTPIPDMVRQYEASDLLNDHTLPDGSYTNNYNASLYPNVDATSSSTDETTPQPPSSSDTSPDLKEPTLRSVVCSGSQTTGDVTAEFCHGSQTTSDASDKDTFRYEASGPSTATQSSDFPFNGSQGGDYDCRDLSFTDLPQSE
ncbi:uncharacterized protein LOC131931324 [Physella acuta]|uniref:uncharacterized protein LOC131931324 n=1 Tax=Physella acuta TaxID=109671 RepID=UPI0027DD444D|nr:uncharacterized protein LOC131931324 [Physella acuta]